MTQIIVHRSAAGYLSRLSDQHKEKIKSVLEQLKDDPLHCNEIRQMSGEWAGYHRIRIGNFRVIFWYDEHSDVVYIDHIGPRGDIYKK